MYAIRSYYVFTELAPWDSLIQRMGRVLREAHPKANNLNEVIERRYAQSDIPGNVFVVVYNGKNKKGKDVFESGQGYVYNDDLLRITLRLIEKGTITECDDNQIKQLEKEKLEYEKWLKKPKFDFKKIEKIVLTLTESDKNVLVNRITSYNVCYTKLLRFINDYLFLSRNKYSKTAQRLVANKILKLYALIEEQLKTK